MMQTGPLRHGGIMVNYQCNASCRHCLYSCSPSRRPGYVDAQTAEKICALLSEGGCRSVHIGGGEPFLNFEGLLMMIRALRQAGIQLDYIETNAFWAGGLATGASKQNSPKDMLRSLLAEGADTLCISIDPFHAEFGPYGAPLALAQLCRKTGMEFFLWKQEYLGTLSRLDPGKTHKRREMEQELSADYILQTAKNYGITYGGRAVNIEKEACLNRGAMRDIEYLASDSAPCANLLSAGHFHADKDCNFIPPGCTGIRIPLEEAVRGIPNGKYRAFEALYKGGIGALLHIAAEHGFSPEMAGYPSRCNLCFHLRSFLSRKGFAELDENHYEEAIRVPN